MIKTIANERIRGCGYRKPGGIYLVSDAPASSCSLLPFELTICPCCGSGVKPARDWTWINGKMIITAQLEDRDHCICTRPIKNSCFIRNADERTGLIWVGEEFYKTTADFLNEANEQGVSRRITKVPRDFVLGKTTVWLAHRKAVTKDCTECEAGIPIQTGAQNLFCTACASTGKVIVPGVFSAFIPQRIEYIITGNETTEELVRKEKAGMTLVKLVR